MKEIVDWLNMSAFIFMYGVFFFLGIVLLASPFFDTLWFDIIGMWKELFVMFYVESLILAFLYKIVLNRR